MIRRLRFGNVLDLDIRQKQDPDRKTVEESIKKAVGQFVFESTCFHYTVSWKPIFLFILCLCCLIDLLFVCPCFVFVLIFYTCLNVWAYQLFRTSSNMKMIIDNILVGVHLTSLHCYKHYDNVFPEVDLGHPQIY